jgi:hypothetical protein
MIHEFEQEKSGENGEKLLCGLLFKIQQGMSKDEEKSYFVL